MDLGPKTCRNVRNWPARHKCNAAYLAAKKGCKKQNKQWVQKISMTAEWEPWEKIDFEGKDCKFIDLEKYQCEILLEKGIKEKCLEAQKKKKFECKR